MDTKSTIDNKQKGMPSGIPFIIGNEAAERFSYYGMKAILTIFMVKYLQMSDSTATEWYHDFGTAVYFLPILGALLSDFVLGKYKTILWLSLVYCGGHLVLAINETREGLMWGLGLIALGSGGIKPCVSAHVGDQFGNENQHLVSKVFNIFYFAINFGSFFATIFIPRILDQTGSPALAFGLPGGLMLLATFFFWLGRNKFVHIPARPKLMIQEIKSPDFVKTIIRLGILYLFISVFWALFDQTGSSWVLQASSDLMDKSVNFFGWEFDLLPSEIQAANPAIVMILVPLFTFVVYPSLSKIINLTPLKKVCVGMIIGGFSFFVMAYAESSIYSGQSTSILWQLLAYVLLTIGEVMVSITALEYSYTQAPNSLKSIIMSLFLFSVSLGNLITSTVNKVIVEDYPVNNITVSDHLIIEPTGMLGLHSGDKININQDLGLIEDKIYEENEKPKIVKGTYLLGEIEDSKFVIWDTNREPVKVKFAKVNVTLETEKSRFSYYKLNGPAYFNFFAWMMLITAILFIPFAIKLKDKTYLQSEV